MNKSHKNAVFDHLHYPTIHSFIPTRHAWPSIYISITLTIHLFTPEAHLKLFISIAWIPDFWPSSYFHVSLPYVSVGTVMLSYCAVVSPCLLFSSSHSLRIPSPLFPTELFLVSLISFHVVVAAQDHTKMFNPIHFFHCLPYDLPTRCIRHSAVTLYKFAVNIWTLFLVSKIITML